MKKILFFIIPVFMLAACNKDLVEQPKAIATVTFYNTPSEVEAGLNAMYYPLKDQNCMGALYPAQLEAYGDYIYGRGSYAILNTYTGLDNTNSTRTGQIWQLFYQTINNANILLSKIPTGSSLTDAQKLNYEAEARFIRGLVYFLMAKNWGGVILRTELNLDSVNIGRSSLAQTYDLIKSDLQFAETNLPLVSRLIGAPNVYAAKAVLTELYLYLQQWTDARDEAKAIIQSHVYSLVPVTVAADFDKIYGPNVVTTTEEIFYLKYSRAGSNYGWLYAYYEHAPGDGHHGAGGNYAHYTDTNTSVYWKTWNNADLRKTYNWYPWNIGLGNSTILPNKFSDPAATNGNNAGNDYPLYKYSDVLLYYAEAESRANGGPDADAVEALNEVHRRAYGYPVTAPSPVDFQVGDYNASSFIDLLSQERNYETCDEAKRWLDLKRTGTEKQAILAGKGAVVADKMLLWPIPALETNYNTAINAATDQNPGY